MTVLSVRNLIKNYTSGFWPFQKTVITPILRGISFDVAQNEIVGFLGPNGAGKTTTIQMLLGALTPTSGDIRYFGQQFKKNRANVLKKIGYASGYDKLPARLTVEENLDIVGRIYGLSGTERVKQIKRLLASFGIENLRSRETGSLSAGQSTRVMLVKAFLADPEIVLLDEPTASLDPDVAHEVRQFILAQRRDKNLSLLITSHNMEEVTELCGRVLVLKQGAIIANDTPGRLAQSTSNVRVHLTITSDLIHALSYLKRTGLSYSVQDKNIIIEIDEHAIAQLFIGLGEQKIIFSHLSVDKPTLQDYFLRISQLKGSP